MRLFSLHCNRQAASSGGAYIGLQLRARIWRYIQPEGRPRGRLLVVRRYDDIYRHHQPAPMDAVLLYEFETPREYPLYDQVGPNCRVLAEQDERHDHGEHPGAGIAPDGLSEGWANCGVADVVNSHGWREHRLLLHGKLKGQRRRHACFRSSPIPDLAEPQQGWLYGKEDLVGDSAEEEAEAEDAAVAAGAGGGGAVPEAEGA